MEQKVRSEEEIRKVMDTIYNNKTLTYGYRDDVQAVLEWVLMGDEFDGLDGK